MTSSNPLQRRKRPDRGQVPPPALLAQGEPFNGYNIVQEWQNPHTVLVWQALRDAMLWAASAGKPGRLFRPTAPNRRTVELTRPTLPQDPRAPLTVLSRLLEPKPPVSRDEVANACRAVSRWAESQGLPQTAISFAQGAALVHPTHPGHAYQVGLLCRRAAEYARAETWCRRALRLAIRAKDSQTAALGWSGLGNLLIQRGDYDSAKLAHLRAYRIARRQQLFHLKGNALHDLFTIAVDTGQVVEAEKLARQAFQAYPTNSEQLVSLAVDVAAHWYTQGFNERALTVFRAALPLQRLQSVRLLVVSLIARAAAGAGDLAQFTSAWGRRGQCWTASPLPTARAPSSTTWHMPPRAWGIGNGPSWRGVTR